MQVVGEYELASVLGSGSMGKVHHASHRITGREVALKIVMKKKIDEMQKRGLTIEKKILSQIRHINIITLFATFQDAHALYFVLEYAEGGDVGYQLKRFGTFPPRILKFVAVECICALEQLRLHHVVHRDIKPENFLISDGHIKLSDFNSAKYLSADEAQAKASSPSRPSQRRSERLQSVHLRGGLQDAGGAYVGTLPYLAPEAVLAGNDRDVGFSADLWSFGCMLYQMIVGIVPFPHLPERGQPWTVSYPQSMDEVARDLISKLLTEDPKTRLGAADLNDLKNHPYFIGVNWDDPPPIIKNPPAFVPEFSEGSIYDIEFTPQERTAFVFPRPDKPCEGLNDWVLEIKSLDDPAYGESYAAIPRKDSGCTTEVANDSQQSSEEVSASASTTFPDSPTSFPPQDDSLLPKPAVWTPSVIFNPIDPNEGDTAGLFRSVPLWYDRYTLYRLLSSKR